MRYTSITCIKLSKYVFRIHEIYVFKYLFRIHDASYNSITQTNKISEKNYCKIYEKLYKYLYNDSKKHTRFLKL